MSEVSNISSTTAATSANEVEFAGELSADEFLDIMIAELANQNPLEPMENNELMAQMTQIESLNAMNDLVEELALVSDGLGLGSASSLIGKLVYGTAENGVAVQGEVEGLVVENETVKLYVNGYLLPLANVEEVTVVETAAEESDDGE